MDNNLNKKNTIDNVNNININSSNKNIKKETTPFLKCDCSNLKKQCIDCMYRELKYIVP